MFKVVVVTLASKDVSVRNTNVFQRNPSKDVSVKSACYNVTVRNARINVSLMLHICQYGMHLQMN
jgi:hypothetical protein